jgi:hypothetical protein
MTRPIRMTAAVLLGLFLVWLGVVLYSRENRPSHSLTYGMTQEQVTAIMGEPDMVLPIDDVRVEWRYSSSDNVALRFSRRGTLNEVKGGKGHPANGR